MNKWLTLLVVLGVGISAGAQERGNILVREGAVLERALKEKVLAARRTVCPRDAVLETVHVYAQECDLTFRKEKAGSLARETDSVRAFLSYIKEGGERHFASSAGCAQRRREAGRLLDKEERARRERGASGGRSVLLQQLRAYFDDTPEGWENSRNSLLGRRAGLADDNQQPRRYNMPR